MEALKQRILTEGRVIGTDILKVDSFLNHQLDIILLNAIGQEFKRRFQDKKVTKILTVEASGIAIACMTAQHFGVPVLFAKKTEAANQDAEVYESEVYSFTRRKTYKVRVSKKYLNADDHVLIVDDFLAAGKAANGLIDIVGQAGATLAGVGIAIEKGFQPGGQEMRRKGIHLESLALLITWKMGRIFSDKQEWFNTGKTLKNIKRIKECLKNEKVYRIGNGVRSNVHTDVHRLRKERDGAECSNGRRIGLHIGSKHGSRQSIFGKGWRDLCWR
jgi:xanthine phosphoribosyltransferase